MSMQRNRKVGSKRRLQRPVDLLAAVILCLIAVLLFCVVFRYIRYFLVGMEYVEPYSVTEQQTCDLIILRDEYPVSATDNGEFTPSVESGSRVAEGTVIGNTPARQVYSPCSGLVYYDVDGWEEILRPELSAEIDWLKVLDMLSSDEQAVDEDAEEIQLSSGRAIARIVDNLSSVTIFLRIPSLPLDKEEGSRISFSLEEGSETVYSAVITEIGQLSDGSNYVLASLSVAAEWVYTQRYTTCYLNGEQISGYSVPASALTTNKEGELGVYCADGLYLEFMPVTVLWQDDKVALIEELSATDRVAMHPAFARAGQKIFAK